MKKFTVGILISLGLSLGTIFAQNILPDEAKITVKSPVIQGEATNLEITMMKNDSRMTSYTGTIQMSITDEYGGVVRDNEYVLPNNGMYTFLPTDLGNKEFQRGLEIKKVGKFYIEIQDINDIDGENILGRELIEVKKDGGGNGNNYINVLNPLPNSTLRDEKVEILAQVTELPNSNILIYIDDVKVDTTMSDQIGGIFHTISNIEEGNHTLRLESIDIDGTIMGSSDKILFTFKPLSTDLYKNIDVDPEDGLKIGDITNITVYTDETAESVKMRLSDRKENEGIVLTKEGNGIFTQKVFLNTPGKVDISLDITAANSSIANSYENVKQISVAEVILPEIGDVKIDTDPDNKIATVSWNIINGPVSFYNIDYWVENNPSVSGQKKTDTESFIFREVPYDTEFSLTITPYTDESAHGAASKTIQFIITKPGSDSGTSIDIGELGPQAPRCTVQNISTRTEKIGDNYYLIRDKVENVTKYIVYSSTLKSGEDKVKVYETSDTSYEYPFDYTSKEDKFAYFRIVGICDDGEELQLTGATKVQVGPAENFFLLVCLTLLIYFGIKLFRETEA